MSRNNLILYRPVYEVCQLPSGPWHRLIDDEYIGEVAILRGRITSEGSGDQGPTRIARIVAPSSMRDQDLSEAISYTLSTQGGCGHSYDCCGCAHHSAEVIHRPSPREYVVRRTVYYNY